MLEYLAEHKQTKGFRLQRGPNRPEMARRNGTRNGTGDVSRWPVNRRTGNRQSLPWGDRPWLVAMPGMDLDPGMDQPVNQIAVLPHASGGMDARWNAVRTLQPRDS